MAAEPLEEGACSDNAIVAAAIVDDLALADDVVGNDYRAGMGELDSPIKIGRVIGLVGVEEDEVEGLGLLFVKLGERVERGTDTDINERCEAGAVDVGLRNGCVFGVQFEGNKLAVGW